LSKKGIFTTIDVPGAVKGTVANGINASGQIVGTYQDSVGFHGFELTTKGIFITIDVPGAIAGTTEAFGINSQGQISGFFTDSLGVHGFVATP
jgi:uncharacterized membrane protein